MPVIVNSKHAIYPPTSVWIENQLDMDNVLRLIDRDFESKIKPNLEQIRNPGPGAIPILKNPEFNRITTELPSDITPSLRIIVAAESVKVVGIKFAEGHAGDFNISGLF